VKDQMALGWFVNFMPTAWNTPWAGSHPAKWTDGQFYLDMARALERSAIDFIMLEDSSVVPENYGASMDAEFKATTKSPKQDPVQLASAIAAVTDQLGIVTTMSTSLYPPDRLAHILATLDDVSGGRAGWNIVTSFEKMAAQNVGLDDLWPHDERYVRANEYVEATTALWAGNEGRADFKGSFYHRTGAPGTMALPQGRPLLCQAGGSTAGMDFAANHADVIVAVPVGLPAMKEYRDGIRARLDEAGQNPDSCRILFMVTPIIGETDEEAQARADRLYAPTGDNMLRRLVMLSNMAEIDFSVFDLDKPIPQDATTNGAQSLLESMKKATEGSSLREVLSTGGQAESIPLIGTPETVADLMEEAVDFVGGDGFLFFGGGGGTLSKRYLTDILDGLVPELQKRGLAQESYADGTFRERMGASRSVSR
jgi:alkanesulfonate monooxygenase SsuD/methylene tetrahydromethanopterin reductase-like flavin-dependent oxidoreductase (luciferase family)